MLYLKKYTDKVEEGKEGLTEEKTVRIDMTDT